MVNLDFILFLLFVAAVLITHLAKRQRIPPPKRDFPESEANDFGSDWQNAPVSADAESAYQNRSIENDWGSSSQSEYEPAPAMPKPKAVILRPLPPKVAATPFRSAYKAIDSDTALPIRASAATKVAKRTSPFADHFRQKRSIQLAVVDRVVLGPCRANAPYGEHQ